MLPSLQEIKVRRKKLDLTQTQLAKEAGVSQSLVAKIEAESIDASYSNTVKIFEALERMENVSAPTAGKVMSPHVFSVKVNETVGRALKRMKEKDYSQLPVFEGKHPVGSISEKTVLDRITQGETFSELSRESIESVMGESFPVVDERTPLPAVSSLLNYHFAVLVRKKDRIAGIVTKADLLKLVGR